MIPLRRVAASVVTVLFLATVGVSAASPLFGGAVTTREYPAGRPPWYRGEAPRRAHLAVAPIEVRLPEGTPASWYPVEGLGRLAARLNERLRAHPALAPLGTGALPADGRPSLYLGCRTDPADATGECDATARELVLALSDASKRWRETARPLLVRAGADHVVIVELTVADHWLTQRDWKGNKEVPLGTDFRQRVPWLSSLDTPVTVLQLVGIVADGKGKVVRSGVEGLLAVPTRFGASVLGLQRMLDDTDLASPALVARAEEALETLLAGLEVAGGAAADARQ